MTKKILLSGQNVNAYYGAMASILEIETALVGVGVGVYEDVDLYASTSGIISKVAIKNSFASKISFYATEARDGIPYLEVVLDENNEYELEILKIFSTESGVFYLRVENLEETPKSFELSIEFVRFFEVEPMRNISHSGSILYAENKSYDIFVADVDCVLKSLHTKTKIGSCAVSIYEEKAGENRVLKYQTVAAPGSLVKREPNSEIKIKKDSLISLQLSNVSIVEDLFFNLVFSRL